MDTHACVCTGCRRNDEPPAATDGLKLRRAHTQTRVYSAKSIVDDLIVFSEVHIFSMMTCLLAVPVRLLASVLKPKILCTHIISSWVVGA